MAMAMVFVASASMVTLLVLRAVGAARHTSILAGMPQSAESLWLGPLYVVVHLFATVLAPPMLLAGVVELALSARRRATVSPSNPP